MQLSTNAGRTWRDATPPRLATITTDNSISSLFALDVTHAWVTYGPVGSGKLKNLRLDNRRRSPLARRLPHPRPLLSAPVRDAQRWLVFPAIGNMMGQSYVSIYRTTDGGRHWHLVSFNTPQTHSQGALPSDCDKKIGFVDRARGGRSPAATGV